MGGWGGGIEGRGRRVILSLPTASWSSLNNSKTVKAVTLEFCSIRLNSIREIHPKFGIHNSSQSPDIGQTSDGGISNFRISSQSLIKENCHNFRTSDNINMKLGPVTKLDKKNKTTSENFDDDVMSVIVTSLSFFGFLANLEQSGDRIPDTESAKVMFSVIGTFCLTKTENRNK